MHQRIRSWAVACALLAGCGGDPDDVANDTGAGLDTSTDADLDATDAAAVDAPVPTDRGGATEVDVDWESVEIAGSCTNDRDRLALERLGDDDSCPALCQSAPSLSGCVQTCLRSNFAMSTGCSRCYGEFAECGRDLCAAACVDPHDEDCLDCVEDRCRVELVVCTGRDRPPVGEDTGLDVTDEPVDPPPPGCSSAASTATLRADTAKAMVVACHEDCAESLDAGFGGCVGACVLGALEVESSCASCFEDNAECVLDSCGADCAPTPFSGSCAGCGDRDCLGELTECAEVASISSWLEPQPMGGFIRFAHLDDALVLTSLVHRTSGAPLFRMASFPSGFAYVEHAAGLVRLGLTAGNVGPFAPVLASLDLELASGARVTVFSFPSSSGDSTELRALPEPIDSPALVRIRVVSALREAHALTVRDITQGQPGVHLADLTRGEAMTPVQLPTGSLTIALDRDDPDGVDPSRRASITLPTVGGGTDITFLVASDSEATTGLRVIGLYSSGAISEPDVRSEP